MGKKKEEQPQPPFSLSLSLSPLAVLAVNKNIRRAKTPRLTALDFTCFVGLLCQDCASPSVLRWRVRVSWTCRSWQTRTSKPSRRNFRKVVHKHSTEVCTSS